MARSSTASPLLARAGSISLALAAATLAACADARPTTDGGRSCVVWERDVQPVLSSRCGACHTGDGAAGGYRVDSYLGALGRTADGGVAGDGGPALTAGDPRSRAIVRIDPAAVAAGDPHAGMGDVHDLLVEWDGDCELAFASTPVHPHGILDPGQADSFHKSLVVAEGYNLDKCAGCHGADFSGGAAGGSCRTCHTDGPTACTTCHGQPPDEGAHKLHVSGGALLAKKLDCTECHTKPLVYTDAGHIFDETGAVKQGAATVTFGALASTPTATRSGPPHFDGSTCANVYCHGAAFADGAATKSTPAWSDTAPAACTGCHGAPPSLPHPQLSNCSLCHAGIADDTAAHVLDPGRHLNGTIDTVDLTNCQACHGGTNGNAAPPRDLLGKSDPTLVTVGAHQAHLTASQKLSAPIACNECHVVPATSTEAGHMDHAPPAIVFPSGAGVIARAAGAQPAWDHATARCTNVYCHGGAFGDDAATTRKPTPLWTGGRAEAECGSCHGVPPVDAEHDASMRLSDCATCHGQTIDAKGNFLFSSGTTRHMNGVVDATH